LAALEEEETEEEDQEGHEKLESTPYRPLGVGP